MFSKKKKKNYSSEVQSVKKFKKATSSANGRIPEIQLK